MRVRSRWCSSSWHSVSRSCNGSCGRGSAMRRKAERALLYAALLILAVPFVFPFWWMLTSSLKSANEIFAFPPHLVPEVWQWQNFVDILRYQPFARHYLNSLYIAAVVTIG